jgi:hypothetical protein
MVIDDVWPLRPGESPILRSYNGFGFGLKGRTRPDEFGGCFATYWFMTAYLPVFPLDRYYVTEGSTTHLQTGAYSSSTTEYVIHGRSRIRVSEILSTYVYQWLLLPGVIFGPAVWLFTRIDDLNGVALVVVWLLCSGVAMFALNAAHRHRWAAPHEPRFLDRHPED